MMTLKILFTKSRTECLLSILLKQMESASDINNAIHFAKHDRPEVGVSQSVGRWKAG